MKDYDTEVIALDEHHKRLCEIVGAKVRYYRTINRMTQTELAKKLHVTRSVIGRIEKGTYNQDISLVRLAEIAEALDISMQYLLTFTKYERELLDWKE